MNLQRLDVNANENHESVTASRRRLSKDNIIFYPDCIFCNSDKRKKVKVKGSWNSEGLHKFESDGWKTVLCKAEELGDENLLRRIRGQDLFACGAHFHKSSRKSYTANLHKDLYSENIDGDNVQRDMEAAHMRAFEVVCEIVNVEVIQKSQIYPITELCDKYIDHLSHTDHHNPFYRSTKLMEKL